MLYEIVFDRTDRSQELEQKTETVTNGREIPLQRSFGWENQAK